jgi:hypothetical protein
VWDDALLIMDDRRESKGVFVLSLSETEDADAEEYSEEATDCIESDGGLPCKLSVVSRPKLLILSFLGLGLFKLFGLAVTTPAWFGKQYSGNFSISALPGTGNCWWGAARWPPLPGSMSGASG